MQTVNEKYIEARNSTLYSKSKYDNNTLTPYDILKILFDENTFVELKAFSAYNESHKNNNYGDGVITCYGQINGRLVYAYFDDSSYLDGSIGIVHCKKIKHIINLATKTGSPVICITDSKGLRLDEELFSLDAQNEVFNALSLASGVIPIISVIAGHSSGLSTFISSLSDFSFATEKSLMYLSTPTLTNAQNDSNLSFNDGFNAINQAKNFANTHFVFESMTKVVDKVKMLLEFLPSNNIDNAPILSFDDANRDASIFKILSSDTFDINEVMTTIFDLGQNLEVMKTYATNIITSFQRLDGMSVGVIANNRLINNGEINSKAARKAASFINICDSFNIPIISLVDTKGYSSNHLDEQNELIKSGARLIKSYANATCPKITLIVGNALGFGYASMCPKSLGADFSFAVPTAIIGVVDANTYVSVVNDDEIKNADNPKLMKDKLSISYKENEQSSLSAAKKGLIDDIIDCYSVRQRLIDALYTLNSKRELRLRKKHTNFPI